MKQSFVIALLLFSSLVFADGQVTVSVSLSPAGSFQAVSKKVKGDVVKQGETFTADKLSVTIESLKTGIELRDEHFWKHLNTSKHPKVTIYDLKAQGGKGTANIEVNGVKKPVEKLTYKVVGSEVEAQFFVKASSFALAKAEYLGVGVEDLVKVEAKVPFKTK